MVAASSAMLDLGTQAPAFSLPDPAGALHALGDATDAKAVLVAFICNQCPHRTSPNRHERPRLWI